MAGDTALDVEDAVDGRVLRGRRNREAIVDAMVAMYEQGNLRPTAAQVADAAGVSTRSVYHHFDDMKSLILEVSARSESRVGELDTAELAELPLADRIAAFADHRCERWAVTGPVVRAGLLAEYDSRTVTELMKLGRERRADEVAAVFGSELADAHDPEATAAGLDVVFGFDNWYRLAVVRGLDPDRTAGVIVTLAAALVHV